MMIISYQISQDISDVSNIAEVNNISAPYRGHFSTSAVGGKKKHFVYKSYTTLTLTLKNPEQDISDIRYIKYT